ncbi:catalase family protein [Pseudomonas sp. OIL-1]|uniref:catalase family protein n=1 Tax=Pseudomonas sp. OIL-1 TaxID=2706126 RepID=UPI0013A78BBE|nr:catalase family protein [Pseudomonas sp. OIL-1]QIB52814.1 catalase family protein [Pseudomonas sp. OIL-1]
MAHLSIRPLPFEPHFEQVDDNEAEVQRDIIDSLRDILQTTYADGGHAIRSVHAKSHGLLEGELTVLDDLPEELAQGAFARPGRFPLIMRLSTNPGDILDDKVSTPRGMALKITRIAGERLPSSENATTQDFVLVNAPVFMAPDIKAFSRSLKLLAKTTDRAPQAKQVLSAVLRGAELLIEKAGGESATLKGLGGHPATNMLGETYYSVVPMLWGPYFAKLSVAPISPDLQRLKDQPLDLKDGPNALRDAITEHFANHGGTWEVRVQLATDLEAMPIEDATVEWPEEQSPYVPVGRIELKPQKGWSDELARRIDDGMSFSPWHGLAAHRPLGGIMRARKPAYEMSAGFRATHNGCPIHEPE